MLPVTSFKDLNGWVKNSWNKISEDMIRKTFNEVDVLGSSTISFSAAYSAHHFTKEKFSELMTIFMCKFGV